MWSTAQLLSSGNAEPHGERAGGGARKRPPERAAAARLIGRDTELATLTGLLFDPTVRILTLTGPAGVGKSRLARAVAQPALFGGDIVTVRLAAVRDAHVAWAAVAAAAGLPGPYGPDQDLPGLLAARFGDDEVLLVLDDCDLVAAGVSLDIARLSAACRSLRILLTSRVSLDIYDERLFPVRPFPLAAPGPFTAVDESPAIRLFVDRARAQRPDYTLPEEDLGVVKEICARLDGLPLAIELSAAAVGMLGPRALLGRLEHGEWPATSRLLDLPARHRTVAASLSWGDPLLTPELRRFLQQLTVLEGQFDLATAQHLTDLSQQRLLGHVETLVHMSLLQRVERPRGDIWFRMLNMVRAYYRDHEPAHGGGLARARDRHAAYFAALASTAETRLRGSEQAVVLPAVRRRLKDYKAAVLHFQDHDRHPAAARTLLALDTALDDLRCLPEALDWLQRSLGSLENDPGGTAGPEPVPADDRESERSTAADGRPTGHRPLIARALETTAAWSLATGRPGADDMLRHAGRVHQALGDEVGAARALGLLAEVERRAGAAADATAHATHAVAELDRLGERRGAGQVRRTLALLTAAHDPDAAEAQLARALEDLRATGNTRDLAITLTDLARVRAGHDRPVLAWGAVREAMELLRDTGGPRHVVRALETATRVLPHIGDGQLHRAARLLLASQVIRERHELPPSEDAEVLTRALERLRETLGESTLAVLRRQARATTPLAALNDALSAPPAVTVTAAAAQTSASAAESALQSLTPRQTEIAGMVASGLTNRQIARALGLSEWTVINHLRQVMQKLKCPSRVHVARLVQQAAAQQR